MKIYIDADACPNVVKDVLFRAVKKRKIHLIMVANQHIRPVNSPYISSIQVAAGDDVADMKIVELADQKSKSRDLTAKLSTRPVFAKNVSSDDSSILRHRFSKASPSPLRGYTNKKMNK